MKVTITSFSYKRGLPEDKTGNGGGFVFDCRAMPNPYWDESLRGYTGRDKLIAEFFDRIPTRSVYFAERMAARLAGIGGVEIEMMHTARLHWKVKAKEKCGGVDGHSFVFLSFAKVARA